MTHTYRHVFANGTKATATITLHPFKFEVAWDGPTSRKLFPEYCRWRQTIFADVAVKTGKRIAIIDMV